MESIKKKTSRFYRKWIKGECRHLCCMCKHRKHCWDLFPWQDVMVTLSREEIKEAFKNQQSLDHLVKEIERRING